MRILLSLLPVALLFGPAIAEESEDKPACLRAKSIIGWAHGNAQIARIDTTGQRWRVTFRAPCLNKHDRPLSMRFGARVGNYCVEPGDELVFVTIGGYEQFCIVEKLVTETATEN